MDQGAVEVSAHTANGEPAQKLPVIGGEGRVFQQSRPVFQGQGKGGSTPPQGDAGVIPGTQDIRHGQALKVLRPGVVRVFQQPAGKTLVLARFLVPHEARQQSGHSLDQAQGGGFAAVQHKIAHGNALNGKKLFNARVQPFVAAADQGDVGRARNVRVVGACPVLFRRVAQRQFTGKGLGKRFALGGKID